MIVLHSVMRTLLWHAIVGVLIFPMVFSMKKSASVVDQSDLQQGNFSIPSQKYILRSFCSSIVRYCTFIGNFQFNSSRIRHEEIDGRCKEGNRERIERKNC